MSKHQWLHAELVPDVIETSIIEMTAVLKCAASLADKEGMTHTAERLRNDAERVRAMWEANDGHLVVIVR